jgi:parallel beta-helix repeat protein
MPRTLVKQRVINPITATGTLSARPLQDRFSDVINVKDFGAKGDGVTDDTAAIQAAFNAAMKNNGRVLIEGPGPYLISSTIQIKITRDAGPAILSPSYMVHFSDITNAYIIGLGMPTLKAVSSMPAMLEIIFDTSDSDIGPFYTKIEGIGLDGNSLAKVGILSNYSMHNIYENNRFWNLERGVQHIGYGVATFKANTFATNFGIYLSGGGGDSLIHGNDFYARQGINFSAGIFLGWWGGNIRITSNIFTNESHTPPLSTFCIQMLGGDNINREIRDIVISDNEFSGYRTAIRADGNSSSIKNIYRIKISGNHTLPFSTYNSGTFLEAVDCKEFIVNSNFINSTTFSIASGIAVDLVRCDEFNISNNKFSDYNLYAISMDDCKDSVITDNSFIDCSTSNVATPIVGLFANTSNSARNYFRNNYFRQTNPSYSQIGISEAANVNFTYSFDNIFDGISEPHFRTGVNSIMRRTDYLSAVPTTGRFYQGDIIWNTVPVAGGTPGWVCTTSGLNTFVFKALSSLAA